VIKKNKSAALQKKAGTNVKDGSTSSEKVATDVQKVISFLAHSTVS
jgi:hypothetical protein